MTLNKRKKIIIKKISMLSRYKSDYFFSTASSELKSLKKIAGQETEKKNGKRLEYIEREVVGNGPEN